MEQTIYEKYGNYFINKFSGNKKLKIEVVISNEDLFCVQIYAGLDYDPYFIRIDSKMIYIDGPVVQDEALEYDNINKICESEILNYLDTEAQIFQNFLDNGVFLLAYSEQGEILFATSTNVQDRKKAFKDFHIESFYNSQKFGDAPNFSDVNIIELRDFYGNLIYEYNEKNKQEKE